MIERAHHRGVPVLVDGQVLATQEILQTEPPQFFDIEYEIPARLVSGKDSVVVRFEAEEVSQIATVFGIRMIRGDAPR